MFKKKERKKERKKKERKKERKKEIKKERNKERKKERNKQTNKERLLFHYFKMQTCNKTILQKQMINSDAKRRRRLFLMEIIKASIK